MAFFGRGQDQAILEATRRIEQLSSGMLGRIDREESIRHSAGNVHPWLMSDTTQNSLVHSWLDFSVGFALTEMHQLAVMSAGGELTRESAELILSILQHHERWSIADVQRNKLPVSLSLPNYQYPAKDLLEALRTLVVQLIEQLRYVWSKVNTSSLPREMRPWLDAIGSRVNLALSKVEEVKIAPANSLDYRTLTQMADTYLLLGQQVIKPSLFDNNFRLRTGANTAASAREPSATDRVLTTCRKFLSGIDPLVVTAQEARGAITAEHARALDRYWIDVYSPESRSDLNELVKLIAKINQLVASGVIKRQQSGSSYVRTRGCPWAPVYIATQTVDLGERIGKGAIFAIYPIKGSICNIHRLGTLQSATPKINDSDLLWKATDPTYRQLLRQNSTQYQTAIRQLAALWQRDDNSRATDALIASLQQAVRDGKIKRCPTGQVIDTSPWATVYVVTCRRVVVGEGIMQGTRFALNFGTNGQVFTREIKRL